jgi:hypothetical protein
MHTSEFEGDIRAELYQRCELPPPTQRQVNSVYDQLDSLAEEGRLSSVTRAEWVKRTPVGDCPAEQRDRYLAFTDWARENGVQLTPFFQTRECFSPAVSDYTDWLVFPASCLAVYDGDSLSAVYPHADGDETRTVQNGVEALRLEESTATRTEPTPAD